MSSDFGAWCLVRDPGTLMPQRAARDGSGYQRADGSPKPPTFDVVIRPMPFVFGGLADLADLAEIFPMFDERIPPEADIVPPDMRDEWYAAVRRADAAGELAVAALMFVAAGVKPGG